LFQQRLHDERQLTRSARIQGRKRRGGKEEGEEKEVPGWEDY
jgi:hypothetical protein